MKKNEMKLDFIFEDINSQLDDLTNASNKIIGI